MGNMETRHRKGAESEPASQTVGLEDWEFLSRNRSGKSALNRDSIDDSTEFEPDPQPPCNKALVRSQTDSFHMFEMKYQSSSEDTTPTKPRSDSLGRARDKIGQGMKQMMRRFTTRSRGYSLEEAMLLPVFEKNMAKFLKSCISSDPAAALSIILSSEQSFGVFKAFLSQRYCDENIKAWKDIQLFKGLCREQGGSAASAYEFALEIYLKYVDGEADRVNISSSDREPVDEYFEEFIENDQTPVGQEQVPVNLFDKVEDALFEMMAFSSLLTEFIPSKDFDQAIISMFDDSFKYKKSLLLQKLCSLSNGLPLSFLVFELKQDRAKLRFVNSYFTKFSGWSLKDLEGKGPEELFPAKDIEGVAERLSSVDGLCRFRVVNCRVNRGGTESEGMKGSFALWKVDESRLGHVVALLSETSRKRHFKDILTDSFAKLLPNVSHG